MELKVDIPSLAGQDIDPETFQRVWNRVMPDQPAARSDSVLPDTARPAEPTAPSEEPPPELSSVPECPALPPVPDCPAEPEPPVCPDCPACPDCPSCPDCPDCPDCPPQTECPDCPVSPPQTAPCCSPCCCPPCPPYACPPAPCLGEASQGDKQRLETLMTLAQAGALAGQALTRRASASCARTLSALARDHRLAFRRLSAAYFLITGRRYVPKCAAPCLPASLALALRQQFVWEQTWEQRNCQAAQSTADPCLKELYLELAQEGTLHAGCIRSLLEQMS